MKHYYKHLLQISVNIALGTIAEVIVLKTDEVLKTVFL